MTQINEAAKSLIFTEARTFNEWQDKAVDNNLLEEIYDLMKFGPTSANCCPLRIVFVKSKEEKNKLKPSLDEGNINKMMTAPVTAIFAYDTEFYNKLDYLFPHADAKSWFEHDKEFSEVTAFVNSTLQAAYFMLAARGLGLDCGPMSGFDRQKLNKAFFSDGKFKSNFLCNLGYGNKAKLFPRSPRFEFSQVCKIV